MIAITHARLVSARRCFPLKNGRHLIVSNTPGKQPARNCSSCLIDMASSSEVVMAKIFRAIRPIVFLVLLLNGVWRLRARCSRGGRGGSLMRDGGHRCRFFHGVIAIMDKARQTVFPEGSRYNEMKAIGTQLAR